MVTIKSGDPIEKLYDLPIIKYNYVIPYNMKQHNTNHKLKHDSATFNGHIISQFKNLPWPPISSLLIELDLFSCRRVLN